MVDQEFKGKAPPTFSELCGGLWVQNDLTEAILKYETKNKIIVFAGKSSLWDSKVL